MLRLEEVARTNIQGKRFYPIVEDADFCRDVDKHYYLYSGQDDLRSEQHLGIGRVVFEDMISEG